MLQVTWSAPVPPNGNLLQYRVIYWRMGQEGSVIQTVLGASQTTYNITGLSPYISYCVQVSPCHCAIYNRSFRLAEFYSSCVKVRF